MQPAPKQRLSNWDLLAILFVLFLVFQTLKDVGKPPTPLPHHATSHAIFVGKDDENHATRVFYVRSEDGGETWSKPVSLSPADTQASSPEVVSHGDSVDASWLTLGNRQLSHAHSRDGGQTWSNP